VIEYFVYICIIGNVFDIVATRCANKIRLNLLCFIGFKGPKFQRKVFERLLILPMLQIAMPHYVVKHKEFLQCEVVCKSLKVVWKGLKYGVGKDQNGTHNVVEVVVFTSSLFTLTTTKKCVGFNRILFRKIVLQRQILDAKQVVKHYIKGDRKVMKDAILKDVKAIVAKWYFEKTKISPNKKKVIHHQVGHKT